MKNEKGKMKNGKKIVGNKGQRARIACLPLFFVHCSFVFLVMTAMAAPPPPTQP
jgi:hypothetical protein